jgi:hypothetical protein
MADRVERWRNDESNPRWIDTGSSGGYEQREPTTYDTREGFSPAVVVFAVQRLLAENGIVVVSRPNMEYTAVIAASDLLRALGVRPEVAPMRPEP